MARRRPPPHRGLEWLLRHDGHGRRRTLGLLERRTTRAMEHALAQRITLHHVLVESTVDVGFFEHPTNRLL
jgi:hypothetical protein